MIEVIRKNLALMLIGLALIAAILILMIILTGKNANKVPLRGVFVNETNILQQIKEGVGV